MNSDIQLAAEDQKKQLPHRINTTSTPQYTQYSKTTLLQLCLQLYNQKMAQITQDMHQLVAKFISSAAVLIKIVCTLYISPMTWIVTINNGYNQSLANFVNMFSFFLPTHCNINASIISWCKYNCCCYFHERMPAKHIHSYILLFSSFFVLFRSQGLSVRKYLTMKSSELRNEPTTAD